MTWDDLKLAIANRIGEPGLFGGYIPSEEGAPQYDADVVEGWMREAWMDLIQTLPLPDLDLFGSWGLQRSANGSTFALDRNTMRIVAVAIAPTASQPYVTASYVKPATWITLIDTDAMVYSVINGQVVFNGLTIDTTRLLEPTLAQLRLNVRELPAGLGEQLIDRTIKVMLLNDFVPEGRPH